MAKKLKGNLIVGQSGGPTAVINNSLCGVIQEAQKHSDIENIYGMLHGIQGLLEENIIDLGRQKPEIIEGLRSTPSAALGSCRYKLKDEDCEKILDIFKKYNVRYFIYNGGNDSMDTAHKVGELAKSEGYELRCMGVPKTVDNDLAFTDHCPGYGSVSKFNAIATRDAGRDTEAIGIVDKVKIIETMGRNTGWITASTALAKDSEDSAPHLIYLPERVFDEEKFLADVESVYSRLGYALITVCEGLKDKDGKYLTASDRAIYADAFGHKQLGGVADYLCSIIADNLKIKARFDKPGTIQRMSSLCASKTDAEEAYMVGQAAVENAIEGASGYMVSLVRESNDPYKCTTGLVPLEKVANAEKPVPDEFINEAGNFVTGAYIEYAKPLIGELPEYVRLEKIAVKR
ncbi:TPA: 6-phosphofructokinase [Candidatus Poribacteria bacterium]|nr:6-phosphofructokinase [Candidatus Poribacteria bacterium]